jgi:hypothetical protein
MSPPSPALLSALYGYAGCIGGVNDFPTEADYMEELKRRNCTVVVGPDGEEITNVVSSTQLKFGCGQPFGQLEWLDGMPITFNFPLAATPDRRAVEVPSRAGPSP